MNAIEVSSLTKKFNSFTAVDSINLKIKEGELFGLLGPNGAGKTTTLSMLSTILKPTEGEATLNSFPLTEQDNVRKSIGIVFQDPSLDFELTGRENLNFHGRLYHMSSGLREERIAEVLKLVEMEDKADVLVKNYSGGMKRRLEIARGLMHHPKILFLDEPTLGLDPQARRKIWEHIKTLNEKEKITIILTTHYMEEADYLCDRIAIIDHGKIIALDTPSKLKDVLGGDVVTIESANSVKLKKILSKCKWVKEFKPIDGKVFLHVTNGEKAIPQLIKRADKAKVEVKSVNLKKPTLEDVFIHYTGRTIREEKGDAGREYMKHAARMRGH
jgi:ABC-2 type transport system ATP-binding protein